MTLLQQQFDITILDERERCAKIVETMRPLGGRMWTAEQHATYEALTEAAKNIRNDNITIDSDGRAQINESL